MGPGCIVEAEIDGDLVASVSLDGNGVAKASWKCRADGAEADVELVIPSSAARTHAAPGRFRASRWVVLSQALLETAPGLSVHPSAR
jgi:hypothetical protein